jgi:transposase
MEQRHSSMKVAGIDVGKHRLDVSVHGQAEATAADNTPAGIAELMTWLKSHGVTRVGLEAGSYGRALRLALDAAGLEVVMHQALEVKLFARLTRRKAKNDRLDAALIAAATARVDTVRAAQDARLVELGERLTAYEHVTEQIVQAKTFLESLSLEDLIAATRARIAQLTVEKAALIKHILQILKAHEDLLARYSLLLSLPGVGAVVAATLVIRMPELGAMDKGQASSLIGVAPFDRDSGQWKGARFISGGRSRPRRMLYLAALQAKRCCPSLKAFADQLSLRGKPAKLILVAVMRKLIEAANLVLKRQQPWLPQAAN